jgi:anti-sigma B factor antagonist
VIRLKVPCSLQYRDVAMRTVAAACKIARPRRSTDAAQSDLEFDDQVVTSFGEAFTNVVKHGAAGEAAPKDVEIEIEPLPDRLTVRLLDYGKPFDLAAVPAPDLERLPESGLGVHILKSWMDDVSYQRGDGAPQQRTANVLSMTKRLGDFTRTDQGDETILRISGVLDAVTAPNIRRTIEALVAENRRSITVDLSALRMIDSSGVGVIVSLYKRCNAFGGKVRLAGLRDQPLSIFKLLRLDRVFHLE